jgi:hypothetical protein
MGGLPLASSMRAITPSLHRSPSLPSVISMDRMGCSGLITPCGRFRGWRCWLAQLPPTYSSTSCLARASESQRSAAVTSAQIAEPDAELPAAAGPAWPPIWPRSIVAVGRQGQRQGGAGHGPIGGRRDRGHRDGAGRLAWPAPSAIQRQKWFRRSSFEAARIRMGRHDWPRHPVE